MVGTIAPLVKVAPKQWLVSTTAFVLASSAGGALLGWSLGFAGAALGLDRPDPLLVGIAALGLGLCEIALVRMPTLGRGVPSTWWKRLGPTVGAAAYGMVLALGVTAIIPFAGFYFILLGAFVSGPSTGMLIGLIYGVSRSLPVPVASIAVALGAEPTTVGDWALGGQQVLLKRLLATTMLFYAAVLLPSLALRAFG